MTHPSHLNKDFGATNGAALPPLTIEDLMQKVSKTCDQSTYAFVEGSNRVTLAQLQAMAEIYPEYSTRRLASIIVNPAGQKDHFRVTLQQHIETTGDVIDRLINAGYTVEDIFLTIVHSDAFEKMTSPHMILMSPHLMELYADVSKAIVIRNVPPAENIANPLATFEPSAAIRAQLERSKRSGFRVKCPDPKTPVVELLKAIPEKYRDTAAVEEISLLSSFVYFSVPGGRLENFAEVYERVSGNLVGKDILYVTYWLANAINLLRNVPVDTSNLRVDAAEFVSVALVDLLSGK